MTAKKKAAGKKKAAAKKKPAAKKRSRTKKKAATRKKAATKKKSRTKKKAAANRKAATKKKPARKKTVTKTAAEPKVLPDVIPLDDLEPSIRSEVAHGSPLGGRPGWAVLEDGKLNRVESVARLRTRIEGLRRRAEIVNRRLREEMRYGDVNDPGFAERAILASADYLERYAEALS